MLVVVCRLWIRLGNLIFCCYDLVFVGEFVLIIYLGDSKIGLELFVL